MTHERLKHDNQHSQGSIHSAQNPEKHNKQETLRKVPARWQKIQGSKQRKIELIVKKPEEKAKRKC